MKQHAMMWQADIVLLGRNVYITWHVCMRQVYKQWILFCKSSKIVRFTRLMLLSICISSMKQCGVCTILVFYYIFSIVECMLSNRPRWLFHKIKFEILSEKVSPENKAMDDRATATSISHLRHNWIKTSSVAQNNVSRRV